MLPPRVDPRTALAASGLRPRRSLGQSFLVDRRALDRIAGIAVPDDSWSVVEIGAGTGALTLELAARAANVVAVEVDRALAELTARLFAGSETVSIVNEDARRLDLVALAPRRPVVVAGNIPYHLTGILLEQILESVPSPDRVVLTVQAEVAERIAVGPGSRAYGALSVLTANAWRARRMFRIGRGAFHPPPEVDSAVVLLEPREAPLCPAPLRDAFRRLVIGVFSHRRKTLRNALACAGFPADRIDATAALPGVRLGDRPERHGVEAFVDLARALASSP